MKFNHKKFSDLILEYKLREKLNFDQLASSWKISKQTILHFVNDYKLPSMDIFLKICVFLKIDANTVIIYEENDNIIFASIPGVKITDGIEYILDRFEILASEKGKIEGELDRYKAYFGDLPDSEMAAEPSPKFK